MDLCPGRATSETTLSLWVVEIQGTQEPRQAAEREGVQEETEREGGKDRKREGEEGQEESGQQTVPIGRAKQHQQDAGSSCWGTGPRRASSGGPDSCTGFRGLRTSLGLCVSCPCTGLHGTRGFSVPPAPSPGREQTRVARTQVIFRIQRPAMVWGPR